jgi:hypothetical protein
MVDVKDIMLGNFVKDKNGEIVVVGKVHRDSVADKWGGITFDDEIEPIPVTEEMLKAIGFEDDTTAGEPWKFWRYWDKDGKYKLDVYPEELYCNSNRKFGLHVDNASCDSIGSGEFTYVHELQNLVRCISGHSLPITKEMIYGNTDKDTLA